jgi:LacI family repressor for deo operon, udp, cdd, tsx, nupC, and nupG
MINPHSFISDEGRCRMATIQDVAKEAGVSVATVSRVINGSSKVSPKARKAVLDAIRQLNYQPNLLGRNLRLMQTKMVLVLLPTISNPFYSMIVKGMEDVAHKNGYNVMLCNTNSDVSREKVYLELMKNRLADGVIFLASEMSEEELSQIAMRFPVVQCCEYKEEARASHVSIDNKAAAYMAVKHLIKQGHRKIGLISCENSFISTKQREEGYKIALEEEGILVDLSLIKHGDYGFRSGIRAMNQFFIENNVPTAVFCISDSMAIGAIKSIWAKGLKVPKDIAVMGFDDINFASMYSPGLTTIAQPQYDLGCVSMELLLKVIGGEIIEPQTIYLEHELIIRESTLG